MTRPGLGANAVKHLGHALKLSVLQSHAFHYLRNSLRYPGLGIDPSVSIENRGRLEYGAMTGIAKGGHIIIPQGGVLDIGSHCRIGRDVELGPLSCIKLGDHVSLQDRCIIVGDVSIGQHSFCSLNVLMTSGNHFHDYRPELLIRDQDILAAADPGMAAAMSRPIVVEEDCWIGFNAVIMRGVRLGRGCVVGANAVVTGDVAPYTVVAGAPARVIKQRLAFNPPPSISWERESDLPYFYRGFELAMDQRTRNASHGGHLAKGSFAVWLGTKHAARADWMTIDARSLGTSTMLGEGDHKHDLHQDWQSVTIPMTREGQPTEIIVSGSPVLIREVGVT
jgi:acetyltransferase-like isoleucine patch superfamily enzyme